MTLVKWKFEYRALSKQLNHNDIDGRLNIVYCFYCKHIVSYISCKTFFFLECHIVKSMVVLTLRMHAKNIGDTSEQL